MAPPPTGLRKHVTPAALAGLAVCLVSGAVCAWLETPLPWMIGPLLGMGTAKLLGANVESPVGGRQTGQLIIGCTLGLYFTPAVAAVLVAHAWLMLLAAALAILLGYLCAFALSRISGIDSTTAFFASVPGGASEMAVLAERYGAALDKVAFAQSLRIVLVIVIVPAALTWAGAHGADQYQPSPGEVRYPGLALLLLACIGSAAVLSRLDMPNAWMLGPLAIGIVVTLAQLELSAMPRIVSNAGQVLLGCALGARFEKGFVKSAHRYLLGVLASIALAIVVSALFGAGLAWLGGVPVPTMILATAPGGIGEMGITAKVLQLGVPLVTAFHVTRIVLLVTITVPIFHAARRTARKMQRRKQR
jgi:membrane AbrB-like protein